MPLQTCAIPEKILNISRKLATEVVFPEFRGLQPPPHHSGLVRLCWIMTFEIRVLFIIATVVDEFFITYENYDTVNEGEDTSHATDHSPGSINPDICKTSLKCGLITRLKMPSNKA